MRKKRPLICLVKCNKMSFERYSEYISSLSMFILKIMSISSISIRHSKIFCWWNCLVHLSEPGTLVTARPKRAVPAWERRHPSEISEICGVCSWLQSYHLSTHATACLITAQSLPECLFESLLDSLDGQIMSNRFDASSTSTCHNATTPPSTAPVGMSAWIQQKPSPAKDATRNCSNMPFMHIYATFAFS